jgi:hypothetical protein
MTVCRALRVGRAVYGAPLDLGTPGLTLYSGIGEADWVFKTSFEAGGREQSAPNVDLVFEGLDTFSVVSLVSRTVRWPSSVASYEPAMLAELSLSRTARTLSSMSSLSAASYNLINNPSEPRISS